jgi:acetophenone carboxylase
VSAVAPWRRRLSELARGIGKPHAPLFAPLLYGVASQIEALPPGEVVVDPTRLGKCLVELRRAVGVSSFVTAAPSAMEAEALGATVDRGSWPPRVVAQAPDSVVDLADFDAEWERSEALAASIETTKRLAATEPGEPPILVGLTGPGQLVSQLFTEPRPSSWDLAGRALSALARRYAQAGASALVVCERSAPSDWNAFASALATVANVGRFHRIPTLVAFASDEPKSWPAGVVAREARLSIGAAIGTWRDVGEHVGAARVVVTAEEVPAATPIEALALACEELLPIERRE